MLMEEPNLVRNILILIYKYNIDYYTANILALKLTVFNTNHLFFAGEWRPYPEINDLNKYNLNISEVYSFIYFVINMHNKIQTKHKNRYGFNCNNSMYELAKKYDDEFIIANKTNTKKYKNKIKKFVKKIKKDNL